MTSSKNVQLKMQTGGKNKQDGDTNEIIGVSLVSDVEGQRSTNIGVCIVTNQQLTSCKASELRDIIKNKVPTCPPEFQICTKQGWPLTDEQEQHLFVHQIINDKQEILIKIKHDKPKCGIKDQQGHVIGFVHINYTATLSELKNLILSQVLKPEEIRSTFQFLDGNSWPISSLQEHHMTVFDILIGQCVSTDLHTVCQSRTFSPPKEPPLKKFKGVKELSFRSGKDVCRQLSSDATDGSSTYKQVLISYVRSEAADNALRLKQHLTTFGLSVYLDVHEIQTGVDWQDSLNFAVSGCKVFVPLVTLKYGETQWTNREVKLADVLGKYILPVNFLPDWPPRCLAIQFATTQFIPCVPPEQVADKAKNEWTENDVKVVAKKIADRVRGLNQISVPSLVKRATIVKSCACVTEDNMMAITSDREGKPLIMICVHYEQETYGEELQCMLEEKGFEVWCTTELDKEHVNYIDNLACSQDDITYSVLNKSDDKFPTCHDSSIARNIEMFREKADDASLVLFVLSNTFSLSRVCQQQVFYCEHRKHVIPILYEDFRMPDWMSMLVGSHGFEMKNDEDFIEILVRRIKVTISGTRKSLSPRSSSKVRNSSMSGSQLASESSQNEGTSWPVASQSSSSFITGHDIQNGSIYSNELMTNDELSNGKLKPEESSSCVNTSDKDVTSETRPSLSTMKTVILRS